jgi:tetratricopeptide (TPR) repeat protein
MGSRRKKRSRANRSRARKPPDTACDGAQDAPRTPAPAPKAPPPTAKPGVAPGDEGLWPRLLGPFVGFFGLSLVLFGRALSGDFLRWDDHQFLVDNPTVRSLDGANLWTLVSTLHQQVYTPLHHLSNAIQYAIWGAWSPGFHLVNLLVFAVGLTVLYRLLIRLGIPALAALMATAVYAAHPSHVESVAWITGLKDVLSFAFAMGAVLFHLEGSGAPARRRPYLSFVLFVCALLSKNTLIVLPALLLVLDWVVCGTRLRVAALRVLPHLAVAAALVPVVWGRWSSQEITRPDSTPALARVGDSYGHYLRAVFWPFDLSPLYPARLPRGWTGQAVAGLAAPLLLGVLCVVRRWWKALLALGWFLAALLPMTNLVPLYYRVNDRYLILPTLALALVAAWLLAPHLAGGLREALARARQRPRGGAILAAVVAVGLGWAGLTIHLSGAWTSDRALWDLATRRQPQSYYAWLKRGEAASQRGAHHEAMESYARAVRIIKLPSGFLRLYDAALGHALPAGKKDPAYKPLFASYARVMARPRQLLALATVLEQRRLYEPAWSALYTARRLAPGDDEVRLRLASSWLKRGKPRRALPLLRRPPRDDNQRRRFLTYKVIALRGAGRRAEAGRLLQRALVAYPTDPVLRKLAGQR